MKVRRDSLKSLIVFYIPMVVHACVCVCAKSLQSCLILCNPMDCSLPGFSVHGILQARLLEWVAVPSSRGYSDSEIKPASLKFTCIGR